MPSASPESRSRKHRRSRSRTRSRSPLRKQNRNDRHTNSKGSGETKSKPKSAERSDKKSTSRPKHDSRALERRHNSIKSEEESRRHNTKTKPRSDRADAHPQRQTDNNRGERNSRFERVRIKEEPTSDDESRRRQRRGRPERVTVKSEFGAGHAGGPDASNGDGAPNLPKDKPNFGLSGKLAEDTNVYNGVVIKYSEPTEARKPHKKWRLYPFKEEEPLPMLPIHRQSAYLLGRERRVADIPIDHPSCSKQHAVLQFRMVPYQREDGRTGRRVRPYIIDLESANGTFVNNNKIEPKRYVELLEKDVMKFGFSSREYVLLHEGSSADDALDDVQEEPTEETPAENVQS